MATILWFLLGLHHERVTMKEVRGAGLPPCDARYASDAAYAGDDR
jgi:hypothetical protein